MTSCGIIELGDKIKEFWPKFLNKWVHKAIKVKRMRERRREFLGIIFKRETELMINHYRTKKKTGRKTLAKLMAIKPHNMEKILDDYFFKVCYDFFKR